MIFIDTVYRSFFALTLLLLVQHQISNVLYLLTAVFDNGVAVNFDDRLFGLSRLEEVGCELFFVFVDIGSSETIFLSLHIL